MKTLAKFHELEKSRIGRNRPPLGKARAGNLRRRSSPTEAYVVVPRFHAVSLYPQVRSILGRDESKN
jgi:hypothetical protein